MEKGNVKIFKILFYKQDLHSDNGKYGVPDIKIPPTHATSLNGGNLRTRVAPLFKGGLRKS
jgi:hypothetical protein